MASPRHPSPVVSVFRRAANRAVRVATLPLPRGRRRAWRHAAWEKLFLPEADVVITSYPKSGRTWLRVMLSHVYHQRCGIDPRLVIDFDNFHRLDARAPRLLFTHQADNFYNPEALAHGAAAYRGKKTVLLVRHPLDLMISRLHHLRHRSRDRLRRDAARSDLDVFAMDPRGGLPTIVAYMNDWAGEMRQRGDWVMVRYEDMRSDPAGQLARVVSLFEPDIGAAEIEAAVQFGSFDNMRRLERSGFFASARMGRRQADDNSLKTRQGKVRGFAEALPPAVLAPLSAYLDARLDPVFGYSSTAAAAAPAPADRSLLVSA